MEAVGRITIEVEALGLDEEQTRALQGRVNALQASLYAAARAALATDVRTRFRWSFAVDGAVVAGAAGGAPDDAVAVEHTMEQVAEMLRGHVPDEQAKAIVDELRWQQLEGLDE